MSLLSQAMEDCCYKDKMTRADGYGGVETVWVDGADFKAAFALDSSMQAKIAAQAGARDLYRIVTAKNINLQFHDVVMRKRDGKIFRVTSDGDDKHTPASAALDMRSVDAEEWHLYG